MQPVIETHDLTKKYGELFAIKSLELDLKKGDVFGFIGPNGAGKTTRCGSWPRCSTRPGARPTSAAIRSTPSRAKFAG